MGGHEFGHGAWGAPHACYAADLAVGMDAQSSTGSQLKGGGCAAV